MELAAVLGPLQPQTCLSSPLLISLSAAGPGLALHCTARILEVPSKGTICCTSVGSRPADQLEPHDVKAEALVSELCTTVLPWEAVITRYFVASMRISH